MDIVVYFDEGVASLSFRHTVDALLAVSSFPVRQVDHAFFTQDHWEKTTRLVVFPGGRDIPYHKKLQGLPNQRIAAYVASGGQYLGICAGAYYGAAAIEFEKGGALEVLGRRELAFFPGVAIGPAFGPNQFCYDSEAGSKIAKILSNGVHYPLYYNGGCYFKAPELYPTVSVVGRYSDLEGEPAAIVKCAVGKGHALLCGVHPEYKSECLQDESKRATFWAQLISNLI